jgi:hypothetical protein
VVDNILEDFRTIQQRLTNLKVWPGDSVLKIRQKILRLWCNQFCITLLLDYGKYLGELEVISKDALENVSYLMNETPVFEFISNRMLLKVPFVWVCVSGYRRKSLRKDSIQMFYRYEPWMTERRCSIDCFPPVLPAYVPLDDH